MSTLIVMCHEYLEVDCRWHDERHDRTGTYASSLGIGLGEPMPIVLKAFEDLLFEENLAVLTSSGRIKLASRLRIAFGGSMNPGEWRRVNLKLACASLKDQDLAQKIEAQGGTCTVLDETDIGFYLMLWPGVTLKQVWNALNKANNCDYILDCTSVLADGGA